MAILQCEASQEVECAGIATGNLHLLSCVSAPLTCMACGRNGTDATARSVHFQRCVLTGTLQWTVLPFAVNILGIHIRSWWPPEPLPGPVSFSQLSTPTGLRRLGRLPGSSSKKLSLALPKTAERLAANKAAARARKVLAPRPTAASHRRPSPPPVPLGAWPSGTERRGRSPRYRWGRWTKPRVPPRMASRGSSRLPPYSPRACPLPPVTALPAL